MYSNLVLTIIITFILNSYSYLYAGMIFGSLAPHPLFYFYFYFFSAT